MQAIKNSLSLPVKKMQALHEGKGTVLDQQVFSPADFTDLAEGVSAWDFIVRLEMPPSSSIGEHRHGANEEIYIIQQGQGLMQLEGKSYKVVAGDIIVNRAFGEHGLMNNSPQPLVLLVLQASLKP